MFIPLLSQGAGFSMTICESEIRRIEKRSEIRSWPDERRASFSRSCRLHRKDRALSPPIAAVWYVEEKGTLLTWSPRYLHILLNLHILLHILLKALFAIYPRVRSRKMADFAASLQTLLAPASPRTHIDYRNTIVYIFRATAENLLENKEKNRE